MAKKHILIIGKSPAVLASASVLLRERGYEVDTTDNFDDIATRFDLKQIDLITTGGQVPPDKRAEIRKDAKEVKNDMLFVQGLAGIPGLIVEQIEGELAAQYRDSKHAPTYDAGKRTIKLFLKEVEAVKVTAWWQTSFIPPNPGTDSRVLVKEQLPAGEHTVSLPADIPDKASFASVQLGKALYCFSLASAN